MRSVQPIFDPVRLNLWAEVSVYSCSFLHTKWVNLPTLQDPDGWVMMCCFAHHWSEKLLLQSSYKTSCSPKETMLLWWRGKYSYQQQSYIWSLQYDALSPSTQPVIWQTPPHWKPSWKQANPDPTTTDHLKKHLSHRQVCIYEYVSVLQINHPGKTKK